MAISIRRKPCRRTCRRRVPPDGVSIACWHWPAPASRIELAIDLGCAAGRTSFDLSARHPSALVLGLDINLALLRLARQAAGGHVSYPRRRIGVAYDRPHLPGAIRNKR